MQSSGPHGFAVCHVSTPRYRGVSDFDCQAQSPNKENPTGAHQHEASIRHRDPNHPQPPRASKKQRNSDLMSSFLTQEAPLECAGRAEWRRRFGLLLGSNACHPKRSRAPLGLRTPNEQRGTHGRDFRATFMLKPYDCGVETLSH